MKFLVLAITLSSLLLPVTFAQASIKKSTHQKLKKTKTKTVAPKIEPDPETQKSLALQNALKLYGGNINAVTSGSPISDLQFVDKFGYNVRCMYQGLVLACVEVDANDKMRVSTFQGFDYEGIYPKNN